MPTAEEVPVEEEVEAEAEDVMVAAAEADAGINAPILNLKEAPTA